MAKVGANRKVNMWSPISSAFKTKLTLFKKPAAGDTATALNFYLCVSAQPPFSDCMNYLLKH